MRRSGSERAHDVLGALQRGHADEEFVRRGAREVVRQVAGSDERVHVALLDLQWQGTFEMREERIVERGAEL